MELRYFAFSVIDGDLLGAEGPWRLDVGNVVGGYGFTQYVVVLDEYSLVFGTLQS